MNINNSTSDERNKINNLYIWNIIGAVVLGILLISMIAFWAWSNFYAEEEITKIRPLASASSSKEFVETTKLVQIIPAKCKTGETAVVVQSPESVSKLYTVSA